MSLPPLGGIVLAGGKSSRMGRDKALLEFGGETMVARAVRVMGEVCERVWISGPEGLAEFGEVLGDEIAGCGPLAGVCAGLAASDFEWNIVMAVDMPLMTAEFLQELAERALRSEADAVVPVVEGREEPLVAAYRRGLEGGLRAALEGGRLKMMGAVREAGSVEVFPVSAGVERFRNVNTGAEWEETKSRFLGCAAE